MSITLLDGGMGQELVARASEPPTGLWATQILLDQPDIVRAVHDDYFAAGAEVATTNTYAILRDRLSKFDIESKFEALHIAACEIAVAARDAHGSGQIAGALGPTGWSYMPELAPPAEEAAEIYAEIAKIQAPFVDFFICETMSSVDQARGAVMGANAAGKPVWLAISLSDDDGTKFRSGEDITEIFPVIDELKPEALLINCSLPESIDVAMPLLANKGIAIGAYANGFTKISNSFKQAATTVESLERRDDLNAQTYADFVDSWIKQGATIVGGCCEVGPEHIREISKRLKS